MDNFDMPRPRLGSERPARTQTEVLYERQSWKLEGEKMSEFARLISDISALSPRRLTEADMDIVQGQSFRGTSLFLTLLSLYASGNIQSINDFSVYNPENRGIQIKAFLASPNKYVAGGYANKYLEQDNTSLVRAFVDIEGKIFDRLLADNALDHIDFPPALLQPVLLGFNNSPWRNEYEHKAYEGVLYGAKPNRSTMQSLGNITGISEDDLANKYPILAQQFEKE